MRDKYTIDETRETVCISGYFNPFHVGHLALIEHAQKYGRLIVIVNNDKQVELKDSVPFQNALHRKLIVGSIKGVSEAIISISQDDSVADDLAKIKPTYFVNAGDQQKPHPKEKIACKENDIEMVFLNLPKICSSSELIYKAYKHIDIEWR